MAALLDQNNARCLLMWRAKMAERPLRLRKSQERRRQGAAASNADAQCRDSRRRRAVREGALEHGASVRRGGGARGAIAGPRSRSAGPSATPPALDIFAS
jgi:hypothetical protein